MVLTAFLERIAFTGSTPVCEETLFGLHRAYTLTVPFENLDIGLGRRITLNYDALYEKIVVNRRGGICYELNGLFAELLRQLGLDVTLLSARVFDPQGGLGREFGHLLVLVNLERSWIADVGFGDCSAEPLLLKSDLAQTVAGSTFRIARDRDIFTVRRYVRSSGVWQNRYSFSLLPRSLNDFIELCDDLQTSAESAFRRQRMCMLRTPDGRVTLAEDKVIVISAGGRKEIPFRDEVSRIAALSDYFGLVLQTE
jgi:N-hydroxyarylamine O-acetyltransferase